MISDDVGDRVELGLTYRTAIVRKLKGLEDFVGVTVVSPFMGSLGWPFKKAAEHELEGTEDDPFHDSAHLRDLYFRADPNYAKRCVSLLCPLEPM